MSDVLLIRYGSMGDVARFTCDVPATPGSLALVRSSRGEELGTVVGPARSEGAAGETEPAVVRLATRTDLEAAQQLRLACEAEFLPWQQRICDWNVDVELIDLERTFDGKLILYVLNDRGPETTKLALRAAAAGFGVIEVQPVGPEGLIHASGGGGCGSCRHGK